MSLNRALGELFKAVRDEAARNPEFAAKLGEAIAIYKPPKRKRPVAPQPRPTAPAPFDLHASLAPKEETVAPPDKSSPAPAAPDLNPVVLLGREGAEALRRELTEADYSAEQLAALIAEHNLDPAGQAAGADRDGLIEQIVSQAHKRVERDKALFNY